MEELTGKALSALLQEKLKVRVLAVFLQQVEINIESLAEQLDDDPKLTEEIICYMQELGYLIHSKHGETKDKDTYYLLR